MTQLLTRARLATHRSRAQSLALMLRRAAIDDAGHALIWSLFPQDATKRGFLYRQMAPMEFLILSDSTPIDEHGVWSLESRDYAPALVDGDRLSFSLRADVQINTPPQGEPGRRERGRREPLHVAARRLGRSCEALAADWLSARLRRHGARLVTIPIEADAARDPDRHDAPPRPRLEVRLEPRLRLSGGSKSGSLQPVLFDGALEVLDPVEFGALLAHGLGKSRAYGCGLLLIRRA